MRPVGFFRVGWRNWSKGSTLIEILMVVAIIAILIALLLPVVSRARDIARQTVCSSRLHSLGQAMQSYCTTYDDWIPGSPNTSGNGANPGGYRERIYDWKNSTWAYYYPEPDGSTLAVHIFDWATPLLAMMSASIPESIPERFDQSKRWAFQCPANKWEVKVNHASRINLNTVVSSYATCKFFTYVPPARQSGTGPGSFFWASACAPDDYMPRLACLSNPVGKVFLADACKVNRSHPNELNNDDYGYTTYGAWLDVANPADTSKPSLSYRFEPARSEAFRHSDGINLLFFDGHVEYQEEGDSDTNGGFGSGARQARFWFPTGTNTRNLPSASAFSNRKLIVP
jgi:prepilin-type processing-associated H-X9-DG protein